MVTVRVRVGITVSDRKFRRLLKKIYTYIYIYKNK